MKKFTVALLYLDVNNLGDAVIHDTAKYLLEKVLSKKNVKYCIKSIDVGDRNVKEINFSEKELKHNKALLYQSKILRHSIGKIFNIKEKLAILKWEQSKQYYLIKNNVIPKLNDVDVIVFAGGGLIKYHKQKFHFIINDVTSYANKHNIPVIFNAVGIEGYDDNNAECQLLKKALNRHCVKAISTRDNIKMLNDNYLNKKNGLLVADSALWTSETYRIKKKKSNTIGLGVIRPEIFKDYLYDVDEKILLKMFSDTITLLKKKNYDVKLFTNGAVRDQDFIFKIKEYMKAGNEFDEMIIPRPETTKELVDTISKFKLTLGTRLHSNIISYSLNIPIIGIVWNIKQLLFAEITNTKEYFVTKENFNGQYIVKLIEKAIKNQKIDINKYKNETYDFLDTEISKLI